MDEEQTALENLPEAFQEAIDNLSNAMDAIDEATEYINEATNQKKGGQHGKLHP